MKFPHLTYSEFIPRIRGLSEKPYNWDGMMMSDVTDIPSYWDGMRCYPVGGDYELKPGRTYRLKFVEANESERREARFVVLPDLNRHERRKEAKKP